MVNVKHKKIVISGINLFEGGALSIYKDFLNSLMECGILKSNNVTIFVHKLQLFSEYKNAVKIIELPRSRENYIFRVYYEWFFFKRYSEGKNIDYWISLHDITPRVNAKHLFTYCHNPAPFYKPGKLDWKYSKRVCMFSLFYKYLYAINIKKNEGIIVQQDWMRKEFEKVTPESVGIPSGAVMELLDELESGFTEPHGLMIMRHGKLCAQGWWAPYAPGIPHGQQSHTKTYAATAVGIAYTEGILSLEERIIDIFPEEAPKTPSENLQKLRVKDVLCMGCGMKKMPEPSVHWIRDFLAVPVEDEPGTTYMYNSVGSTLLGAIVRKKTGLGLHDYLKPRLFDKIGIDAERLCWAHMPDGMEVGGGGLFATTEDNLRLMKLYADGGVWDGERILSEEYVKLAVSLQNESATESEVNPEAYDNFVGYGYQIWMCRPEGVYRADGAMGQFTIVDPGRDLILAITENASGAHWAQRSLDVIWAFFEKIKEDSLPEDPEASGRLARRMASLSLANPGFQPESPMKEKISGREYRVTEGELCFYENGMLLHMAGMPALPTAESIRFQFEKGGAVLHYVEKGQKKQLAIAMDGSRRENSLSNGVISRALVSGRFAGEAEFEMTMRWVETCGARTYRFILQEDGGLLIRTVGSSMANGGEIVIRAAAV